MRACIRLLLSVCILTLPLAACGTPGQAGSSAAPQTPGTTGIGSDDTRQIRVRDESGHTVSFRLNDSPGARSLYAQLPLTVAVEQYGDNEMIFYPPEKLDITDTPAAHGGAGVLAYYAPWGDVVLFYGAFQPSSGLYALGEAQAGGEVIRALTGQIRVEAVPGDPPRATAGTERVTRPESTIAVRTSAARATSRRPAVSSTASPAAAGVPTRPATTAGRNQPERTTAADGEGVRPYGDRNRGRRHRLPRHAVRYRDGTGLVEPPAADAGHAGTERQ